MRRVIITESELNGFIKEAFEKGREANRELLEILASRLHALDKERQQSEATADYLKMELDVTREKLERTERTVRRWRKKLRQAGIKP